MYSKIDSTDQPTTGSIKMRMKSFLIFSVVCFMGLSASGQTGEKQKISPESVAAQEFRAPSTPVMTAPDVETPKDLPKIVITENRYSFGAVAEGETVVHEFEVQNKGTAPLVIEKVKTG
jgi:hypothetical protein